MKVYQIMNERASVKFSAESREMDYLQRASDLLSNVLEMGDRDIIISCDPPYDLDKSQHGVTIGLGPNPSRIYILSGQI